MAKPLTAAVLTDKISKKTAELIGLVVTQKARALAPFRTGALMRSLDYSVTEVGGKVQILIGSNLEYAAIQEGEEGSLPTGTAQSPYTYRSGAGRIASRPFIANAIFLSQKEIAKLIIRGMNDIS